MMLSLPLPVLAMTVLSLILFGILLLHNYRKLEQKSIESKNNNKLRQTFIDADNRMIYLKDEKLKYIFFNRALENFFNRSASEIKGNNDYALIDQEFASLLRKTDQAVLEKKERIVETLNWRNRIYQATKFPVKLNNGRYGVGAYIEDITAISYSKRQEEKSLLRSSILVDVFTRNFKSSREQLDYVLDKALALTESKYGYIYLYDEAKQDFILNSWSPGAAAEKARDELEKTGLWGELVRRGKPILVNNHHAPNSFQRESAEGDAALKRLMSIPVMVEDKIVAAVVLADKEEDYDDNDLHQVTVLMTGVWHAIERRERAIELREANLTLQENQEKLQLILDSTAEGIYGIDREGRCTFCNASCLRMLGYSSQEELIGKNMHWQIHHSRPDGSPISLDECRIFRAFRIGKGIHADDEVLWRADGSCFAAEYYSYPQFKDGKVIGAVVTFMDITERKKVEEEIRYISYHDSLTGLYNRAFFIEELKRLDTERNLPLAIIMGDMNGLKLTNDIFGHAAGDMLLQKGAAILKKVCRADDIIARIGGDEFVI
ncbi:MAG: diguanylate cyclase, partial [Firmicutes bacterium]|nr:diguanylate cyclase [Bacillota bacterium]